MQASGRDAAQLGGFWVRHEKVFSLLIDRLAKSLRQHYISALNGLAGPIKHFSDEWALLKDCKFDAAATKPNQSAHCITKRSENMTRCYVIPRGAYNKSTPTRWLRAIGDVCHNASRQAWSHDTQRIAMDSKMSWST